MTDDRNMTQETASARIGATIRRFLAALALRRWLRRFLWTLVTLVTLIALFYAIENWRGSYLWNRYKTQLQEQGEELEMKAFVPEPIPQKQNFGALPEWQQMFAYEYGPAGELTWPDGTNASFTVDVWPDSIHLTVSSTAWKQGKRIPLQQLITDLQSDTSPSGSPQSAKRAGSQGDAKPTPPKESDLARRILNRIDDFDDFHMRMKSAANERPNARFPIHYEEGYRAYLPHLSPLKGLARMGSMKAVAKLHANNLEGALNDLQFLLWLAKSLKNEPLYMSQLVRASLFNYAIQPLWEGIARHRWNRDRLKAIQRQLANFDFLRSSTLALRGQRALQLDFVDLLERTRNMEHLSVSVGYPRGWKGNPLVPILVHGAPAGWYDLNKRWLAQYYRDRLAVIDAEAHRVFPENGPTLGAPSRLPVSSFISRLSIMQRPPMTKALARSQATADIARVACALKRYRQAEGSRPERLRQLEPDYITELPHDVITGDPLIDRPDKRHGYLLYSVGWDQKDDNGNPSSDWVWHGRPSNAIASDPPTTSDR